MHLHRIIPLVLSHFLVSFHFLPLATAQQQQQRSTVTCFSAPGFGTAEKPEYTFFKSTTSTKLLVLNATRTETLTGRVPDHTVTVHRMSYRTEWHEEYIDEFTTTIWDPYTRTLPRPTITIYIPPDAQQPLPAPPALPRQKRQEEEEKKQDDKPPEDLGMVIPVNGQEKPTKYNTVVCNTIYFTTLTETQGSISVINHGRPARTITLTVTHTEIVNEFATLPARMETETVTTLYTTYTTFFEIVTTTTGMAVRLAAAYG